MNEFSIQLAHWETDQTQLMRVRNRVFIEEQKVPAELELDQHDPVGTHIKALDEQLKVIATARFLQDHSIGRMCVLKQYRNLGVGSKLLQFLIENAQKKSIPSVHLNAQINAVNFYQKFGFTVDSEIFVEAGIDHIHMTLNLLK